MRRQEEKGITEDEMVGWHHQLKRHEFKQTPGDSEGQGSQYAAVHTAVGHDLATKQQGTGLLLEKLAQNHSVCVCCKSRHLFFCPDVDPAAPPLYQAPAGRGRRARRKQPVDRSQPFL